MSDRVVDWRSRRFESIDREKFPHGTCARYVSGCRCADCRRALSERANARSREARSRAGEVAPSGPPAIRTITRGGKQYRIKACPGAGGAACVRGGGWLRDKLAQRVGCCMACVERATVWNGLVPADRAREHVAELARLGIGYKTVADACGVARSAMQAIRAGEVARIRSQTERRILAVDEGCRADKNLVAGTKTKRLLKRILARGFTQTQVSRELGCSVFVFSRAAIDGMKRVEAATELRVEKLWRRVQSGELQPRRRWVPAAPAVRMLREFLAAGVHKKRLSELLGYPVSERGLLLKRIRPETAAKVKRLHAEWVANERELRERYDDALSIDDFATARPGDAA